MQSCAHSPRDVICDHRTGEEVCTACGLVLCRVFGEQVHGVKHELQQQQQQQQRLYCDGATLYARRFVENVCIGNGWMLPAPVVETSLEVYRKLTASPLFSARRKDAFLAFSIYEACQRHECAVTYRELERWAGVSRAAIGRVQRTFAGKIVRVEEERLLFPASLIVRYGPLLDLSSREVRALGDILRSLSGSFGGGRCPHVLAAALFIHFADLNGSYAAHTQHL